MDNLVLWVLFTAAAIVVYRHITALRADITKYHGSLDLIRNELHIAQEKIAELTEKIERTTLTPTELEAKYFDRLPALTSDMFISVPSGKTLSLILKVYTEPQGFPLFYPVEYTHRELAYRSPGQKDAVAYGKARFDTDTSSEARDVRILFSGFHSTAALRGLSLVGNVKAGKMLPNNTVERDAPQAARPSL